MPWRRAPASHPDAANYSLPELLRLGARGLALLADDLETGGGSQHMARGRGDTFKSQDRCAVLSDPALTGVKAILEASSWGKPTACSSPRSPSSTSTPRDSQETCVETMRSEQCSLQLCQDFSTASSSKRARVGGDAVVNNDAVSPRLFCAECEAAQEEGWAPLPHDCDCRSARVRQRRADDVQGDHGPATSSSPRMCCMPSNDVGGVV